MVTPCSKKRFSEAQVVIDAALDETAKWEQRPLLRVKAKLKISQSLPTDAIETYRYLLALVQAQRKAFVPPKNIQLDESGGTSKGNFGNTKSAANRSSQRALSAPTIVHVSRPEKVKSKRKDLPIVMMEPEILEAINENISLIICGETGCGKTTQVPQFLYEAGFGSKLSSIHSGVIGVKG